MNKSSSAPRSPWPLWLTPVLAAVLVMVIVWALGVTVFRGALVNRGLPEEIRGASSEEFAQWRLGAQFSALAMRAQALEELADSETAEPLHELGESLTQGAALFGEIHADDAAPVVLPTSYSVHEVQNLTAEVFALGADSELISEADPDTADLLVRAVFEVSLDARSLLHAASPEADVDQRFAPLQPDEAATGNAAQDAESLSCLSDPSLLDPQAELPAELDPAAIYLARALDRGYALDYVLQLQAARGLAASAPQIEAQRSELNDQLAALRAAGGRDCADLRQLAYELPEGALQKLGELAGELRSDFINELLAATAASSGESQAVLASALWQILWAEQALGSPVQLLSAS